MWSGFVRILLAPFSFMFGHSSYSNGQKLEKQGKYKEACYQYAVALLNGGVLNTKGVKSKIKELWEKHGPFDYDEDLKKEIAEHGDTPEHCAEAGHAAVMSIIKESIA